MYMNIDWKNKKVAVLGMGVEGESSVKFLLKQGAKVTQLDQETNKDYVKKLESFDIIVRSPGIKRDIPEILAAEKKGVIVTSHIKIFFDLCPGKIIGVTGTKGKGTTSALIYEMLKKQRLDAYLGGNIGNSTLDFLDKLTPQSWVVLELSSFQLQDATISPDIAVVLMITQEHLVQDRGIGPHENYHIDIIDYVNAKRNILRFQNSNDFAVINCDYLASHESDIHTEAQVYQVSREVSVEEGCFIKNGKVVIRTLGTLGEPANQKVRQSENLKSPIIQQSEFSEIDIIKTSEILLPGEHNWENVCAAVMAATLAGVSKQNIAKVLKTFKGLEHRLELVSKVGGVRYYDDSFSTTPETAIAAIQAFKNPEVVILGGAHKGSDFSELGRVISKAKNIKAIIGIGLEWLKIKSKIPSARAQDEGKNQKSKILLVEGAKDMTQIVHAAAKIAQSGDVVLLSPACSSFDMFKNYNDRGEQFKKEVHKLASSD